MTTNELYIAFLHGCAFTFLALALATWMLEKVDSWWGHRQHRKLENQKVNPDKDPEDAVSGSEVGFRT